MTSFVLVPGAGGMAWYWHRAVPLIRAAGHDPIAVELPGDDRHAGLAVYADIVIQAIVNEATLFSSLSHWRVSPHRLFARACPCARSSS